MSKPISVKLEGKQRLRLDYLSERNYQIGPCKLIRIGIEFLTKLAEQNGGQIPLIDQVRLHRALTKRAKHDAGKAR